MKEDLFVPSSPEQAQRVIDELGALLLRERGVPDEDFYGLSVHPDIPRESVPQRILERHIIADFELQIPTSDTEGVNPYVTPDAPGTRLDPLAGLGISRELATPHVLSLSEVSYFVVRRRNMITDQSELQLQVVTTFDTHSLTAHESEENQVNQPLFDIDALRQKMADNPFAAERELEGIINSPTVSDLVLSDEQNQKMHHAAVSYQEADIVIGFIAGMYR